MLSLRASRTAANVAFRSSVPKAANLGRASCHCQHRPMVVAKKYLDQRTSRSQNMASVASDEPNKSFVLQKINTVTFENRPVPKIQDPMDVIINVKWTGICGSDVHYLTHGAIGPFVVKDPMVLGHESAGIVESVGAGVTTLKVGDRVCMEPGQPCRHCDFCKSGNYNLCPDMAFAATPPYDGTLCKYYRIPADFCYKLPEQMSLEEGALMEPLSVGVHIAKQADIKPGQTVVVYGAGPVGLMCMTVAKAFGASKIIAVDINEERLNFAKSYAATGLFRPKKGESPEESAARLIEEHDLGYGADASIDATGAAPCIQQAIHVTRVGGTYVQGGMGAPDINFPIMAACTKELTIRGSFRYSSGDYALAVSLVEHGRVSVKELVSSKVKFEEAEAAFEDTKNGVGIKNMIEGPQ